MSLQHHTLVVGAVAKTLAEWGVTSAVLTTQLGGEDTLSLEVATDVTAAPVFSALAEVQLFDPSNVRRFRGRVTRVPRVANASSERQRFTAQGAGYWLERVIYKRNANFAVLPGEPTSETGPQPVSEVILFRNLDNSKLHLRAQVEDVLEYAIDRGAPIAADIGALPTLELPEDQVIDLRCSDVLGRALAWTPHLSMRWDYAPATPQLVFLDTTDGVPVARTLTLGSVTDFSGDPRHDLLVTGYRITYISENIATVEGEPPRRWRTLHHDEAGDPDHILAVESTIRLRGHVFNGSTYEAPEPRPADGLAAEMLAAFGTLAFDLSWSTVGEEVDWASRVGEWWSVPEVSGYADARAVCQAITRDIGAGRTSFRCGPAAQLGLGSRLDLFRANRQRNEPRHAGEQSFGMKEPDAPVEKWRTVRLCTAEGGEFEVELLEKP